MRGSHVAAVLDLVNAFAYIMAAMKKVVAEIGSATAQ